MREIPLAGKNGTGRVAVVDDHDYPMVAAHRWCVQVSRYGGREWPYAVATIAGDQVRMHRLLSAAENGQTVDHRNGNTLDNRRENLRAASKLQQMWNRRPNKSMDGRPRRSQFKGVEYGGFSEHTRRPWRARITVGGRKVSLGRFETEWEAAREYNSAAREHFGEFAALNVA